MSTGFSWSSTYSILLALAPLSLLLSLLPSFPLQSFTSFPSLFFSLWFFVFGPPLLWLGLVFVVSSCFSAFNTHTEAPQHAHSHTAPCRLACACASEAAWWLWPRVCWVCGEKLRGCTFVIATPRAAASDRGGFRRPVSSVHWCALHKSPTGPGIHHAPIENVNTPKCWLCCFSVVDGAHTHQHSVPQSQLPQFAVRSPQFAAFRIPWALSVADLTAKQTQRSSRLIKKAHSNKSKIQNKKIKERKPKPKTVQNALSVLRKQQ